MRSPILLATLCCALTTACAPPLDWRELRPVDAAGLAVLMPCRATSQERPVMLAGHAARLVLQVCEAGGRSWALAHADVQDPARVGPALAALLAAAAANLGTVPSPRQVLDVPGATPQAAAGRQHLLGRRPDGTALTMETAVFARGTRVFQASVLGADVPQDDSAAFFASLRFPA